MKRVYRAVIVPCLLMWLLGWALFEFMNPGSAMDHVRVGFIFENDESTPYTYNFILARDALANHYGDRVEILTCSNVREDQTETPLRELAGKGCDIIFFNSYSQAVQALAPEYPGVQFCQVSFEDMTGRTLPENYHTFKSEIYQGRYAAGVAAGMKLKQMIAEGEADAANPLVGYVAAYRTTETISGYTAFLLGVRAVVPEAAMRVRYTGAWSSYSQERSAARALIDEGCVILSQHTDTIGPAVACEEASRDRRVYYIGLNQDVINVAPTSSLMSIRYNWEPYVLGAVEAVMTHRRIESAVPGRVHGTDMSAGFDLGWVELLALNRNTVAPGTEEAMQRLIERFQKGGDFVFRGDYTGVNPDDPSDTISLTEGYRENENSSCPTFGYILEGITETEG